MLQSNAKSSESGSPSSDILSPAELILRCLTIIRRHLTIFIGVPLIFLALAIVYLAVTPPEFTATSVMVIDTRKSATATPGSSGAIDSPIDNPTVESQAEILRSENIALAVIRDLKLLEDPDFAAPTGIGSWVGSLLNKIRAPRPDTEFERKRAAMNFFASRLNVKRVGVTFVFEISFTSHDRERAAQIANAVADAYVIDQLEAKYTATRRAGAWLQDRLKELGKQASDAERAVASFKARNNIVDTGGRLMNEQQLSELNTQLAVARANTSEAQAKLARIDEIMREEVPDANVTDALRNEVIIKLRNQYVDLQKRAADLTLRIGPEHQAVINVRNDMREARRSMLEELRRIAAGYKSDYEISKARLESIQSSLLEMVSQSQTTSQAQVELKELDSAAQSYRTLYDSFLQRYMESVQQQSFPLTEARVVTQATAPLKKSKPRFGLTLLGALIGGSLVGFSIAWLREVSDRTIRTASEVESLLGVSCVSSVPFLKTPGGNAKSTEAQSQKLAEVIARPISRFAEAIRAIKVAVDFFPASRKPQIIGIISSLPGEGKSTLAANLAALAANSGSRAVLIDGDLRNPSLTSRLMPNVTAGLVEVLAGQPLEQVIVGLEDLRCDFIPAVRKGLGSSSNEFISSAAMQHLLDRLKLQYDYVIVDLPPLAPVIDARAAADLFDCFVLVVKWGATSADIVQSEFHASSRIQMKTVGVVLNKVDVGTAERYDNYTYSGGRHPYYAN